MSFYNEYIKYRDFDFESFFKELTDEHVLRAISKEILDEYDFMTLLSKRAEKYLEEMAQSSKAHFAAFWESDIFVYTLVLSKLLCQPMCLLRF